MSNVRRREILTSTTECLLPVLWVRVRNRMRLSQHTGQLNPNAEQRKAQSALAYVAKARESSELSA
jgi:hypothetical protein